MQEHGVMRWLQLTYKVPSEPSQKRVWVWRRLQNLGAYALQNSVYLLPYSDEVEKLFRQLAHDIQEMGGEASIFSVVALDVADEQRILHALLDCRNADYNKVVNVCARFLSRAVELVEKQEWNDQLQAEFSETLEKVHLSFRSARRHDVLGSYTAIARASAAEAIAVCEQVFRVLQVRDFSRARRLLEMNYEWTYHPSAAEQTGSPCGEQPEPSNDEPISPPSSFRV
ncbi:Chromate resistance protein ChrB [Dictyobacter aurantiacus]|uniref:ChrB N-terminal domain-containing protein n=1 Tax=Dictyobacter aurantiacus TaxID=1936993 RepID=A0A401Z809_9CHLR|nr:Chromate resistance protein ChrB [Dictyobacter aurantiacus]GCE02983.1 hypothetical protein KDAU_03120 [Dictyobacter aurantiacus]